MGAWAHRLKKKTKQNRTPLYFLNGLHTFLPILHLTNQNNEQNYSLIPHSPITHDSSRLCTVVHDFL